MFQRNDYLDQLKSDFGELIEALDLPDLKKHFLRSRWLDQVLWMEGRANSAKVWYLVLRLTTIVGGVIIPGLVKLSLSTVMVTVSTWTAFGVSLLVAITAAVDGFLRFGEQWRHYRWKVELLKNEGWQFLQLSGKYTHYTSHAKAYKAFATRVERLNQLEVETYITEVTREKEEAEEGEAEQANGGADSKD